MADRSPDMIEVAGRSMEPSIARGTRLRVVPIEAPPRVGEVVLIRGAEGWIVHRLVRRCPFLSGVRIFHVGDGGGRPALALPEAVVGRIAGAIPPADALGLEIERVDGAVRQRFRRARIRTGLYCVARRLAERFGLRRWGGRRPLAAIGRRTR